MPLAHSKKWKKSHRHSAWHAGQMQRGSVSLELELELELELDFTPETPK
jgi:hypothetical protein